MSAIFILKNVAQKKHILKKNNLKCRYIVMGGPIDMNVGEF